MSEITIYIIIYTIKFISDFNKDLQKSTYLKKLDLYHIIVLFENVDSVVYYIYAKQNFPSIDN